MGKANYQKIKLLRIMEILRQDTDEEHPMSKTELCARLNILSITCDPRTLHHDITLLNEQGYEVMSVRVGHDCCYYIEDRNFSIPELKILMDAVQAASFITEKKTEELIDKLSTLAGTNAASLLQENIVHFNTRKHKNETIYYSIDAIEKAIQQDKRFIFKYFDLDEKAERKYRKDGHHYIVEPVALVYNEDNYYLVAYSSTHGRTNNYRLDRMDAVEIVEEPISDIVKELRKDVAQYTESAFKMYGGESEMVTLQFHQSLIGTIYDKFGEKTKMTCITDTEFVATVTVQISPTFWGWLFQFGGKMKIISPDTVKEAYQREAEKLLNELKA